MERNLCERDPLGDGLDDGPDLAGVSHADRVADRNLESTHLDQRRGDRCDARRRDLTLEWTPERRGDISADPQPELGCARADGSIGVKRRVDALIDVLLTEGLGCRGEHRDFADLRPVGPLETREVGDERGVSHPGAALNPGKDVGRVRHLRHPFRADEGTSLYHR